ncbi:flavodoxin-dependent (E)-4-hydroxy-3-methylbut-2-enyl-diphosphate synthase [Patescibacteria group bacterium]|nr:flavodoxin-dependent (E)-4-hydroxy-3-methylbut-2-enyl-diphosphate synthase [Patescibacteria group bacterium]MBU1890424.1 flavodoxin-dependent (E)-4-hydroxy-3-methylbut-2-enyl-diphosphate synthase [Patescibacteria group bacterium]
MIKRRQTKEVKVGNIKIGAKNPIIIQSMCNTDTRDSEATIRQIGELQVAGCELVRVAVPDMKAARALGEIKKHISIPLVADIHFDYNLALEAINQGVDKIRINPGNIGSKDRVKQVVQSAKDKSIPIRIGVNSGSLEKEILKKHGGPTAEGMVESALGHVKILEDLDFKDIIIAIKATDVLTMVEAHQLLATKVNYPHHLGVTEAGLPWAGTIKSSVGIGSLLTQGIGDTIRVSLTGDPVEEVKVGWEILKSLNLRERGRKFISCPTCGRTEIDLVSLAKKVDTATQDIDKPITIAVMGCAVNGPGEAREADIGVAGAGNKGIIFKKGKVIATVSEAEILPRLLKEIDSL